MKEAFSQRFLCIPKSLNVSDEIAKTWGMYGLRSDFLKK